MSAPTRIMMHGARGRMGRAIVGMALEAPGRYEVVAGVDVGDDVYAATEGCEVVIDFSHADATPALASLCASKGCAMVIGTTGHDDLQRAAIEMAARAVPVVFAPNFSIGVNTLFWLAEETAKILGDQADLEVLEMHHRLKKDAPSGTARRLAEILCATRGWDYERDVRHGREGMVGARTDREIGMHAVRGGSVVGDHTVVFAMGGERVELRHCAETRETFAAGALRSAEWVKGKCPGIYDMQDVLGLRGPRR